MKAIDRRLLLRNAALGSLVAVATFHGLPAAASTARLANMPRGTLRLTRTIERSLIDGASIRVHRGWDVNFAETARGWLVSGVQVSVDVSAPPALAALAEIEQQRDTSESFPIALDHAGMIVGAAAAKTSLDMREVAQTAERIILARGADRGERLALNAFLSQLQTSADKSLSVFPQDLFFPSEPLQTAVETVDLGGGMVGKVELIYAAETRQTSGLLLNSSRVVTTRLQGQAMRSVESWSLA